MRQHRTRNLEIPGLVLTHHPGMTMAGEASGDRWRPRVDHLYLRGPASLGNSATLRWSCPRRTARGERETQGADDTHNGGEFGIAAFSERLVEAFAVQARIFGDLSHATC